MDLFQVVFRDLQKDFDSLDKEDRKTVLLNFQNFLKNATSSEFELMVKILKRIKNDN